MDWFLSIKGGLHGLGETLTYASQRLLTRHSLAREFPRNRISARPFPNKLAPFSEDFKRLQAGGFADWRLSIDGMVYQPASLSIADLKSYPSRSQISEIACEEGSRCFSVWISPCLVSMVGDKSVVPYRQCSADKAVLKADRRGGALTIRRFGLSRFREPRRYGF